MPVPRHRKQWVSVRTNCVQQQGHRHHTDHDTGNNTPCSNVHYQQYCTTDHNGQGAYFAHGAWYETKESVHPGDTGLNHFLNTAFSCQAKRRRTCIAISCSPDCVPRHVCRISKEQESTTSQCWVQEVFTCTTEDLFTDHNTEGNTQSDLPKRDRWR